MDGFKRTPRSTPQRPAGAASPAVPPKKARNASLPPVVTSVSRPLVEEDSISEQPSEPTASTGTSSAPLRQRKPQGRRFIGWLVAAIVVFITLGGYVWYEQQLKPVDTHDDTTQRFAVADGSSFSEIVSNLKQRDLIRSQAAFDIYARLHGERDGLKASTCSLKRSMTSSEILKKLVEGCHDFISVMFYPGATIEKPLYKPADATIDQSKMYIKYVLKNAGFTDTQIQAALSKQYDLPLFADKPAGTSLEGYIFGETYYVDKTATAEEILQETFAEMNRVVASNDLVAKYKAHGLNLYQGITLASIVQRELNCEGKPTEERKQRCYGYQQRIAQVFLNRLKQGISLGSDVTFIYAADMMKVSPSVDLDSPYNTRKYAGLPPGPIASPGALALKAVGNPSGGDDLYFIAGDDGLIYFAKDEAGHQKNIHDHCQQMCGNAV